MNPTRLLVAAALLLVFAVASLTEADPDLWGHVRFGADVLRTHELPSIDPYSFTQDRPWINHEWLSELQMGLAWTLGATTGLVVLKGALVLAALVVVWLALRRTDFGIRLIMAALFVLGAGRAFKTLRPQLWSILCFAILCRVLAEPSPRGRRWLPVLFLIWANVHGGWLVGLGVLGVWTIVSLAVRPREAQSWLPACVLCALATLMTPYGWRLWLFLWETVGVTRDITEWQPLWTVPVTAWAPWLAAVGVTVWAFLRQDPDRWGRTAVVLMLGYFSLRVERVLPFFVTSAVLLAAPIVSDSRNHGTSAPRALASFFAIAMAVTGVWVAHSSRQCIPVRGPWIADREAAQSLEAAEGRLVVPFDWGEYAIWHVGPRLRVSMDGRRETVYTDRRIAEHDAILAGTTEGFAILDAWRPEYVWLPRSSERTRQWLETHGYRVDVSTKRSFVAVREEMTSLAGFAVRGQDTGGCFPD